MSDQKWFSIPEFAKLIGWHRTYVWKLVKARLIKTAQRNPGSFYKIPRSEVVKWGLLEDENEVDLEI